MTIILFICSLFIIHTIFLCRVLLHDARNRQSSWSDGWRRNL